MAVPPPEDLPFDEDDLAPVVAVLEELTAAEAGWVNLAPDLEDDVEAPVRSALAGIFSARGDAVPLATWTAPEGPGQRASIGVTHGSGPKALARLAQHDLALPAGWLKRADHPRRGLVVTTPADADPADVLWWLLAAGHALSTVPLSGSWRALVYRP